MTEPSNNEENKIPNDLLEYDVRNSPEEREYVQEIIKTNNAYKGSKYMKPAFSVIGKPYN